MFDSSYDKKTLQSISVTNRDGGCVGKDPDAQGSGSKKRDLFGAGKNLSQTQAGVRIAEGQIEGRSKDRVSK